MREGLVIDLFAGAGGMSLAMEAAGLEVDYAINHDPVALAVHKKNHPKTIHLKTDIFKVKPKDVTKGRRVRLLHGSPDCRDHSRAKGGKPLDKKSRCLPWSMYRWAHDVRPDVITVENVPEFRDWGPLGEDNQPIKEKRGQSFRRWIRQLEKLGYIIEHHILNAADYGAPTSRKRFFMIARCDGQPIRWPLPTHGGLGLKPLKSAAECIDFTIPGRSIFGRKKDLAKATQKRIFEGLRRFVINNPHPYIVGNTAPVLIQTSYGEREGQRPRYLNIHEPLGTIVAQGVKHSLVSAFLTKSYKGVVGVPLDGRPLDTITTKDHHSLVTAFLTAYYSGEESGGQDLREPLRTIPTKDRFGLVIIEGTQYQITDIRMRMLTPEELLRAQFGRFAASYDLSAAKTIKNKVRLIGNSVCPELGQAIIAANFQREELREAAE